MHSLETLDQLFFSQYHSSCLHHAWIIEGADRAVITPWLEKIVAELVRSALGEGHFHPNISWLDANTSYTVDAIRNIIEFLGKTSWDGGWKVCVIMEASQLNHQAQNAILKSLEEPPEHSIIFLIAENPRRLLPTLYSRGLHIILDETIASDSLGDTFIDSWLKAIEDILIRNSYEKLFALQEKLVEEDIPLELQARWVMSALKYLINSSQGLLTQRKEAASNRIFLHLPPSELFRRWEAAQKYILDARLFNVDQKQFCVKLTTKILQ